MSQVVESFELKLLAKDFRKGSFLRSCAIMQALAREFPECSVTEQVNFSRINGEVYNHEQYGKADYENDKIASNGMTDGEVIRTILLELAI